jgi:predicted restriction endonuclease
LIDVRIGQGQFRKDVMRIWRRCPVTGCEIESLLHASHIKPWKACSNKERLDPFNGLLLAPSVHEAFDKGLITFDESGRLVRAEGMSAAAARRLGIPKDACIALRKEHLVYMKYHRDKEFAG